MIIFEDADIPSAVAGTIASKFRASGQTCVCCECNISGTMTCADGRQATEFMFSVLSASPMAPDGLLKVRSNKVYDEFTKQLVAKVKEFKVGSGFDEGV